MRFLRNTTLEEVDNIIERSSDKMLIYVNDAPAGIPSVGIVQRNDKLNITIKIFRGYKTPEASYEYAFNPSTVLADVANTVFEDHPDISSWYNIYSIDYEFEDIPPYPHDVPLDTTMTLLELGITSGGTLSFCENLT